MAKFKIKKKDCLLTVKAGDAGAKADIGVQLYGEDGKLKPQFGASAKAEATAAELEGSLGVNVLGGEVGVSGSLSVGVGAHADVGYKDGVFKFDIGASIGLEGFCRIRGRYWRYGRYCLLCCRVCMEWIRERRENRNKLV